MIRKNKQQQNFFFGISSLSLLLMLILVGVLWTSVPATENTASEYHTNVHQSVIDQIINYENPRPKTQSVVGAKNQKFKQMLLRKTTRLAVQISKHTAIP